MENNISKNWLHLTQIGHCELASWLARFAAVQVEAKVAVAVATSHLFLALAIRIKVGVDNDH